MLLIRSTCGAGSEIQRTLTLAAFRLLRDVSSMSFLAAGQGGADFMVDPRYIPGTIEDPSDYVDVKRHTLSLGVRRLWCAVVEEAFHDLQDTRRGAEGNRAKAKEWLAGADSRFPFSRACIALGLSFDAWQRMAVSLWQATENQIKEKERRLKVLQRVEYRTRITENKKK